MKRLFCLFVVVVITLAIVSCGSAKNSTTSSDNPTGASSDTSEQKSSNAGIQSPPSIPVEELVLLPITRKKIDTTPEAILQTLKDAWVEFNEGEMADQAKYLELVEIQTNDYGDTIVIETGNSVRITIESRSFDDMNTGETVKEVYSVIATDTSGLLPIWPSVNIYIIIRNFVCETVEDAHAITALLQDNDESMIDIDLLYPMYYGGYRIEIDNRFFEKSRISLWSSDHFDTIMDGVRVPLPQLKDFTLMLENYEEILVRAYEYIGSDVTVELTVMHVSDGVIYGYISGGDKQWSRLRRVTVSFFENEDAVSGFAENDTVVVSGVLEEARTEVYADIYNYNMIIRGNTAEIVA